MSADSPGESGVAVLRYQPITSAVITDACLNTRWHHGAYISPKEDTGWLALVARSGGSCRDSVHGVVGTMNAAWSRHDWLLVLSSANILATAPVYDPTELSRANRVATVQRTLSRPDPVATLSRQLMYICTMVPSGV